MKKILSILLSIMFVVTLAGCSGNDPTPPSTPSGNTPDTSSPGESNTPEPGEGDTMPTINIQVGDKNFTATFNDNDSARAIIEQMPFTLNMDDFGSQEKVKALSFDLPSAQRETPSKINAGEIYLWSGNNLVLFYTSFSNSYSYVPIGRITDTAGLRDALGRGSVTVTFSVE